MRSFRNKKTQSNLTPTFSFGMIWNSRSFSTKSVFGSGKYRSDNRSNLISPFSGHSGDGFLLGSTVSSSGSGSTDSYSTTRSTAVIVFSNSADYFNEKSKSIPPLRPHTLNSFYLTHSPLNHSRHSHCLCNGQANITASIAHDKERQRDDTYVDDTPCIQPEAESTRRRYEQIESRAMQILQTVEFFDQSLLRTESTNR